MSPVVVSLLQALHFKVPEPKHLEHPVVQD